MKKKNLPSESMKTQNFLSTIFPWPPSLFCTSSPQAPRSLFLTWLQSGNPFGEVTKNSTWRLSDVDSVIIIDYISCVAPSCPLHFHFLFICLPLWLKNIMEKQITVSPLQATAKTILQQKVKTLAKIFMAMLKPKCWLTC